MGKQDKQTKQGARQGRPIFVQVEPELFDKIKTAAAADDRTVSAWIRLRLREHFEKPGK